MFSPPGNQVQTKIVGHVCTQGEIDAFRTAVDVVWDTPFESSVYTISFMPEILDNLGTDAFAILGVGNKTRFGFTIYFSVNATVGDRLNLQFFGISRQ